MDSLFAKFFSLFKKHTETIETIVSPLDYDKLIHLDAENLAEQGIAEAYQRLIPELTKYIDHPEELTEVVDRDLPSYKILFCGTEYFIYSPEIPENESWIRASYFFFLIVNKQLLGTGVQLYAIDYGNDLGGMLLTPEEVAEAQSVLPRNSDWPYIPVLNNT